MKVFNKFCVLLLVVTLTLGLVRPVDAAISPVLGALDDYSVLGGSIVTNTGNTTANGHVGVSPSIGVPPHITGFPPGIVGPPGDLHDADTHAAAAQAANTATFAAIDQGCDTTYAGVQDLTLVSPLVAGVYCATGSFSLTGNLTLSGTGVWIFKSASTIITSPGSSVTGGDPCNLWWRAVSSVTLDTTTSFRGNILALTSITMNNGASLAGRALAQTGAVTMNDNTITTAACASSGTDAGDDVADSGELPNTSGRTGNIISWNLIIIGAVGITAVSFGYSVVDRKRKDNV